MVQSIYLTWLMPISPFGHHNVPMWRTFVLSFIFRFHDFDIKESYIYYLTQFLGYPDYFYLFLTIWKKKFWITQIINMDDDLWIILN